MRHALALLVLLILSGASLPLTTQAQSSHVVQATNFAWTPASLVVERGDTVAFTLGSGFHNWVSDAGMGSCSLPCTQSFPTAGEFPYHCGVHPDMTGTVIVLGDPAPDLRVATLVAVQDTDAADPESLQRVTIHYTAENAGTAPAGAFDARVEAFLDGSWTTLAEVAHAPLAVGERVRESVTWDSADALRIGTFSVRVALDVGGVVTESSETNNARVATAAFVTALVPGTSVPLP